MTGAALSPRTQYRCPRTHPLPKGRARYCPEALRAAMVLGHSEWGRGITPMQQVFPELPLCAPSPRAVGRQLTVPALRKRPEPKEGTGHLQRPVCSFPGASSVPSALPGTEETRNTCSPLSPSDFPNPFTCLPEHGQSSQKGLSLLSDRNLTKEAVLPSTPRHLRAWPLNASRQVPLLLPARPLLLEDHAIQLSPSPVAVRVLCPCLSVPHQSPPCR